MGLTLDPTLERILNDLGFEWPMVDETDLFNLGGDWMAFGSNVAQVYGESTGAAMDVLSRNHSDALERFRELFEAEDAPARVMQDAATGVQVVGGALFACAGIVLAVKIYTIINLIILAIQIAQAIATAFVTFGASLAEIPIFKIAMQKIIGAIINEACVAILG